MAKLTDDTRASLGRRSRLVNLGRDTEFSQGFINVPPFRGSTGGIHLVQPIVGMARVPSGDTGYWLVANDGGVFSFGSAQFEGSTAGHTVPGGVVGIAAVNG